MWVAIALAFIVNLALVILVEESNGQSISVVDVVDVQRNDAKQRRECVLERQFDR